MGEWKSGRLSDLVQSLDAGVSVNSEDRPHGAGEIGILKTSALHGGVFHPEQNKAVLASERTRVAEPVVADTILFSRMNTPALVGESCYVAKNWPSLFVPDRIWQIKPKDRETVSMRWLSFALRSAAARAYIETHASGTSGSMKNLPKFKLLDLALRYPPAPEQRRIAEVLDALDTTLRQTEVIIEKLKQVKQGLLHDLLTRGIDANGELRPPQSQAPHLYKDSPLGWIPVPWGDAPLGAIADLQVGFAFKSQWFRDSGDVRLLRGDNVGYGAPDWDAAKFLTGSLIQQFNEYLLNAGDVVVGMDRSFTKTGAKFSVVQQGDLPCLLVQRVGRFIATGCEVPFLRILTLWPDFHRRLMAQQKGMDIPHLSKTEILEPIVPVPDPDEQKEIASRIAAIEARLTAELRVAQKLKLEKSGLMDDLLTGRVRVTPLLAGAAP